jgi:hypothetical protein
VVAETASAVLCRRGNTSLMSVPLPAPEGPEITKRSPGLVGWSAVTIFLDAEEAYQFTPLPLGETSDGLVGADTAVV